MNTRPNPISEFAQDLYDVLGMNTNFMTQKEFYNKYVDEDQAFMVDCYEDVAYIYFDDYRIEVRKA